MKTIPTVLLLFTVSFAFSQSGKIELKNPSEKNEGQTTFIYEPTAGLNLPEDAQVSVSCSGIRNKSISLEKKATHYEFSFKLPAESSVFFFAVVDSKQNALDNNHGKGYVINLRDPSEEGFEQSLLEKIESAGMAAYFLKLDYTEQDILDQYESVFANYPELKNGSDYVNYLLVKFSMDKEKVRPELIAFADTMAQKEDEESLTAAYTIYRRLDMNDNMEEIEKVALERFPAGDIARGKFMMDYYSVREKDVGYITGKIDEYLEKFGDKEKMELNMLYYQLLALCLDNKDSISFAKYADQMTDQSMLAQVYNSYAWKSSGGDLSSPGEDLDLAEQASLTSLDIIEYLMEHPETYEGEFDLEEMHRMCADTYALILYKQKKYDLAFKYQHEIVLALGDGIYADGKERYAAFAEKARGPEFARDYLEKQLLAGTDSKAMVEQLQKIYAELNLPENEFENIKKQYMEAAAQKDKDEIIKMYGDIKAIDFTLPNLEDKEVKLSDFTGKVVVLDFWATWCGPCLSSFPKMQKLVTQFENENVEFFFINAWESEEREKIKEKVMELLEKEGYTFHVLFDYNDEVIRNYKIKGIPTRLLIDKSGNMKTIVRYNDDLAALITDCL